MSQKIQIDHLSIDAEAFSHQLVDGKHVVEVQFQVKHEEYHEVTTLLYKDDFHVKVPNQDIAFYAKIANYSTSVTNLYKPNTIGEFTLKLLEKN